MGLAIAALLIASCEIMRPPASDCARADYMHLAPIRSPQIKTGRRQTTGRAHHHIISIQSHPINKATSERLLNGRSLIINHQSHQTPPLSISRNFFSKKKIEKYHPIPVDKGGARGGAPWTDRRTRASSSAAAERIEARRLLEIARRQARGGEHMPWRRDSAPLGGLILIPRLI